MRRDGCVASWRRRSCAHAHWRGEAGVCTIGPKRRARQQKRGLRKLGILYRMWRGRPRERGRGHETSARASGSR
eukprot:scaffold158317_cov28-Tisochrysis_lutea.AAC.1